MIADADILDEYQYRPFDLIEYRLDTVRTHLLDAPLDVVATALTISSINSIISASTHVKAHERATLNVWDIIQSGPVSVEALTTALDTSDPTGSHHVMYYNNKAEMIHRNILDVDFVALAELYQTDWLDCQQQLVRDVTGLGNTKAAFTLANLGVTQAACIDSVMHRAFDATSHFDAVRPFETVVTERYYDRVDRLRELTPEASEQMDRYIWQWCAWSVARNDGFTVHDPWFMLLDELLEPNVFDPPTHTTTTPHSEATHSP